MSQLTSTARAVRPALRGLERAAVERARLALVPVRRVDAPRAPFAVLVFLLLGAGVVGLLMFNTQMQQDSFYATRLQHQADRLTAQQESLRLTLDRQRDPQMLAQRARGLGMVQPPVPAAIDLRTGQIFGIPTVATSLDGVGINPSTNQRRPSFVPPTKVVKVIAKTPTTPAKTGQSAGADGPASAGTGTADGRNVTGTAAQGAPR
jgi:hypothetical protein